MKWEEMGYIFFLEHTNRSMKNFLKVDLAVSKFNNIILKTALERVHTARHSPRKKS